MLFRLLIIALFWGLAAYADDFARGEAIFKEKCSSCHAGHIPVDRIKKNFFEMNNTLLHLEAPSVNMLVYAITKGPKKIGDPSDEEMRQAEIEVYLKEYLSHPDRSESICDPTIMRHYATKPPLKAALSDEEYAALARYFMDYGKERKKKQPRAASVKKLSEYSNAKEILAEAKRSHRRIIIEAESKHCHYCRKMKREVIDNAEVRRLLDKGFILISVDVDRSQLPFGLQKVYKHITPSFFFLDENGDLLNHYPGSWKKGDFLQILEENLEKAGGKS